MHKHHQNVCSTLVAVGGERFGERNGSLCLGKSGLAGSTGGFMPEVTLNLGLKAGQSGTIQRRYLQIVENTGKEVTRGKECARRHRSWRGCGMQNGGRFW